MRHFSVVFACLSLAACASNGKRPGGMSEVQTIAIAPDVVMPDSVSYLSAGQLWGSAVGGLVGGAIVAATSPKVAIKQSMEEGHVDVGAITVDELRKALQRQDRFKVVDAADQADAVATIEIKEYGFKVAGPFRTNMHVLAKAVVTVTAKDGTVLYHRNTSAHNSEATTFPMSDFLSTPSNMELAFHEVGAMMGDNTARAMAGRPVPPETPEAAPVTATPADNAPAQPGPAALPSSGTR